MDYEPPLRFTTDACHVRTELVRERPLEELPILGNSRATADFVCRVMIPANADKEYFVAIYLDGKHRAMAVTTISVGCLTSSLVHPREVFRPAIALCASALILAHNHPSGDPTPSPEDVEITARLREVGKLTGIRLLDHVIVTELGGALASIFEGGVVG